MNTMDSTQIIMTYKAILTTTGKMLTAAQNNEWDQLVSLEQECRRLTETLKKMMQNPFSIKSNSKRKSLSFTRYWKMTLKLEHSFNLGW
jgi:flagellar protein FliT